MTPKPDPSDGPTRPSAPTGHTALRDRRHALIFNAITRGLAEADRFVALSEREAIARRVGEVLDAETLQCAEEAERALAQARDAIADERRGRLAAEAAVRRAQALADRWSAALGVDIAHARALREALDAEEPR